MKIQYSTINEKWLNNIKLNLSKGTITEFIYWCSKSSICEDIALNVDEAIITHEGKKILSGIITEQNIISVTSVFNAFGDLRNGLDKNQTDHDLLYEINETLYQARNGNKLNLNDEIGYIRIKANKIYINKKEDVRGNQRFVYVD